MFTQVLSCHVTLYYYMGFAYLMTRRYVDAIKIFSYFLTYVSRNKHLIPRSHNAEVINKRVEQMWGLLAIAFALCPDNIDDFIINEMKEKFGKKLETNTTLWTNFAQPLCAYMDWQPFYSIDVFQTPMPCTLFA